MQEPQQPSSNNYLSFIVPTASESDEVEEEEDKEEDMNMPQLVALLTITMIAMAANSVLSRFGIDNLEMDPLAFSGVRLAGGATMLASIVIMRQSESLPEFGIQRCLTASFLLVRE